MSVIHRRSRVCFDGFYEWWGASCTAHLQLKRYLYREANFIIEITNMHIYDFGPKAMLSNAGL